MNPIYAFCVIAVVATAAITGNAQDPYLFKFVFKGVAYQTNATGNIVGVPFTDRTMIEDRAAQGGVDPNTLTMVYHLDGDEKGDTVEIVDKTTGQLRAFQFGFWFGDDRTLALGRSALTNSSLSEIRRVDQLFTLANSTFTSENSHGMGTAFITKRFIRDTNGVVHTTIEGPLQWIVAPHGTNGTRICHGTFVASQPLF